MRANGVSVLKLFTIVTDYGDAPAPADLVALYNAAPKVKTWRRSQDEGLPYEIEIVDDRTEAGKAFYKREAEVLRDVTAKLRAEYEAAVA